MDLIKLEKKEFEQKLCKEADWLFKKAGIELTHPCNILQDEKGNSFELCFWIKDGISSEDLLKIIDKKYFNTQDIDTNDYISGFLAHNIYSFIAKVFNIYSVQEVFLHNDSYYIVYEKAPLSEEEKAKKVANDVVDLVNSFSCKENIFAEEIANSHRTLQQNVMRLIMTTIKRLANNQTDGRNEATVELAKKIISEDYCLPFV